MLNNINQANIISELYNIKNWKRTTHKIYDVYACKPAIGTRLFNKYELSHYEIVNNNQFVISGTAGEQWVVSLEKLINKYMFVDGRQITEEELFKRMNNGVIDWMHLKTNSKAFPVWAFHVGNNVVDFPVTTSKGTVLIANSSKTHHGIGDFILCSDLGGQPNLNDCWVVNGNIFPLTYDMRAFPGLCNKFDKVKTPVPHKIETCIVQNNVLYQEEITIEINNKQVKNLNSNKNKHKGVLKYFGNRR